jgi:uncharacterized protein (DUF58 family)
MFQFLDPAEVNFDFKQPARFQDVESGRDMFLDPTTVRREYLERFEAHTAALKALCERLGIGFRRTVTDQPLELSLYDFLKTHTSRGKIVRRTTAR